MKETKPRNGISCSSVVNGNPFTIGDGFEALSFKEKDFKGMMDPLIMVDHYTMSKPTFGAHPHAGLSAVSIIFEDSVGKFHNRDSLGNNFDILPGDLYWLKAGSGIVHDEAPREGSKIHGLQVFVNIPAAQKYSEPESLYVQAKDIPVINSHGARVRVVLGESNSIKGENSPSIPLTILDGLIEKGSNFKSDILPGDQVWVYAVDGEFEIAITGSKVVLSSGQSIALHNDSLDQEVANIINISNSSSKFVMFIGTPLKEGFVQRGPFAMSTEEEIDKIEDDYNAGKFGEIA